MTGGLSFEALGPLSAFSNGVPVRLGGPKERLVLACLLTAGGRVVSVDKLVDVLWGDAPPDRAVATLQVHVSNLRRRFGDAGAAIVTQAPGYVLPTTPASLDLLRFEELGAQAQRARSEGRADRASELLTEADSLWQGEPLADLEPVPFVTTTRIYLEERRAALGEDRTEILLESGRTLEALTVITQLLSTFPLRESLWAARMLALYRLGRQAEALAAYRDCRERLLDELGVEPSASVRSLHQAMLQQDPALDVTAPAPAGDPAVGSPDDLPATFMVGRHSAEVLVDEAQVVPLVGVTTIGRHPGSTVVLSDSSVSRRHAEVRPALGGHILLDLESSNGTQISDRPVVHHLLEDGDEIRIGPHRIIYRHTQT